MKPVRDAAPEWVNMLPREVEAKVVEMAKEGLQPAIIGLRLRDQFGIPSVHEVTGKRIGQILEANKLSPKVPQDLTNLIRRSIQLAEHLQHNRGDLHNRRGLEMIEARIRRLIRYHKIRGDLEATFKYTRGGARLLVD